MALAEVVFWGVSAGIAGIAGASFGWSFGSVFASGVITAFFVVRKLPHLRAWTTGTLIVLCIACGYLYFGFRVHLTKIAERLPQERTFSALVIQEPRATKSGMRAGVKLLPPYAGNVMLFTDAWRDIRYGDVLSVTGKIKTNPPPESPIVFANTIQTRERNAGNGLKQTLFAWKRGYIAQFDRFLSSGSSALMAGLTFGSTNAMSVDFKSNMSLSGTTHLTALSGYNIIILINALKRLFEGRMKRNQLFLVATGVIALFVLMTGAEASVVRAAIMGSLLLLAGTLGRAFDVRNAIALTAGAMLFLDPALIRFDIGFQLSFLSLLGIIYLGPAFQKFFRGREHDGGILGWREHAAKTTAAQLAVLPILLTTFGQFSATAIIANALILEFVPLAMACGFLLVGAGLIFAPLAVVIAPFAEIVLRYMTSVIDLFAYIRIPISVSGLEFGAIVLYYLILLVFVYNNHARLSVNRTGQ